MVRSDIARYGGEGGIGWLRLGALLLPCRSSVGLDVLVPRAGVQPLTIDLTAFFRGVYGELTPAQSQS